MLALRITPVEEDAEQNERWRPWHHRSTLLTSTQSQPADQPADDRLLLRMRKPGYLQSQLHSILHRLGLCSH